jgi:hypothetical protein
MKRLGWLVALGYGVVVSACGGESKNDENVSSSGAGGSASTAGGSSVAGSRASGPSVEPDTTLENYPRAYTEALCRVLERCDPRVTTFAAAQGCVTTFEPLVREQLLGQLQPSLAAGTVTYHPEALPTCLSDWERASCDDASLDVMSCEGVFSGNVATGEACQHDVECEGRQCLITDQCPGTCGKPAALSEPCSQKNACAPGLDCLSARCVKGARIGELCGESTPCLGYGLCYADPASPNEPSRCVARGTIPRAKDGAPCELTQEPICADGLVCSQGGGGLSFGTCRPPVAASGKCVYSFPDPCPTGQFCRITMAQERPIVGLCTPKPALGEACVTEDIFATTCAPDQICDLESGLCILGKHLNEACTADEQCFSAHCAPEGVCAAELECERQPPM